jgi:ADP-dependent NAD(P)H-hydrate dehydratase / NAD(P)H-hydrate epimerase
MRFITPEQMRAADERAVKTLDIPSMLLMRRAGIAVARTATLLAKIQSTRKIILVAGHGNNGGDICVAARCLHEDGFHVQVLLTSVPAQLRGDAHAAWDEMRVTGVPYTVLGAASSWDDPDSVAIDLMGRPCVLVDGLLGTGCVGAPTGVAKRAIQWMNQMRSVATILAADLPSGMNGETGVVEGECVRADVTVTFARPKRCFLNDQTAHVVGHLSVVDIGIPAELCDAGKPPSSVDLIALPELTRLCPNPVWSAHKGQMGQLLILGGSPSYPHAPVLSALGALKSGAGLVTLSVPSASAAAAAHWTPEAILRLRDSAMPPADLSKADVIVAGPGLSQTPETLTLIEQLLATPSPRLVLDADGLHALAQLRRSASWKPRSDLLLTPHPGEAAILLETTVEAIQQDRLAAVRKLADHYQATVVLKGAGTLVCKPEGTPWLNRTGNPGMASAGMGDVLAGIIGARWAQIPDASVAACMGVWVHGTAGDLAALKQGQTSLTATTLVQNLPEAFQMLTTGAY